MTSFVAYLRDANRRLVQPPASDLPVLNGVRAWSILAVFALHVLWPLSLYLDMDQIMAMVTANPAIAIALQGHFGVDAFFVLSGFLIASLYFRDFEHQRPRQVRDFFIKRALRLLPPYYAVLILAYTLTPQHCPSVWSNFLYINNYYPMQEVCVFWSWSLAIEEQFYLSFPLFCVLLYRVRNRHALFIGLLGCAALGNIAYLVYVGGFSSDWDYALRYYQPTQFRFGSILMGVYAAYLNRHAHAMLQRWAGQRRGAVLGYLSAFALMLVPIFVPSQSILRQIEHYGLGGSIYEGLYHYLFSLGVAVLLLLMTHQPKPLALARHLSRPWYYPIAKLSYGLYLVHPLVILEIYSARFETVDDLGSIIALSILGSLAAAYLLYLLIEAPAARLRSRLLGGRPPNAASPFAPAKSSNSVVP